MAPAPPRQIRGYWATLRLLRGSISQTADRAGYENPQAAFARAEAKSQPSISGVAHAVVYTRASSDDQAKEGTSLDVQLAECRRYAMQRGFAVDASFTT